MFRITKKKMVNQKKYAVQLNPKIIMDFENT